MDDIRLLWTEHSKTPYPEGYGGIELVGVELVTLDADIAGCISAYLHSEGQLDSQRTAILSQCYREVSLVVPQLSGVPLAHFTRLERMASKVLEAMGVRGAAV